MKKEILFSLIFFANQCFAMTWNELIDQHKGILRDDSIVQQQYKHFTLSHAPAIADPIIKAIPIHENGEECVDLRTIQHARIHMLPEPEVPFESPYFNSGLINASKMRSTVFAKLEEMVKALDELAPEFGYEIGQIDIKVFEGLRDIIVQQQLFEERVRGILLGHPDLTLEMAEQEAAKWVSPYKNNIPVHATGAAIDIRLMDSKTDTFLDMGDFGMIWGDNVHAPTFSEDISDVQKRNRFYCLAAADKAGLTNYVYEFWHFSFGDRYDAYWKEKHRHKRKALYGLVE